MKAYAIYPLDADQTAEPKWLEGEEAKPDLLKDRTPVVVASPSRLHWGWEARPCVDLMVLCPKGSGRTAHLKFHVYFHPDKRSQSWAIKTELRLSAKGDLSHQTKKVTISGNPANLDDATRNAHLDVLCQALRAVIDHAPKIEGFPEKALARHAGRLDEIRADILEHVLDYIQEKQEKKDDKSQELADRAESLNALPDGAPLRIRQASYSRRWQLTVKRGRIERAKAHHLCIIKPEEILSEEFRKTGLPAHDIMGLYSLAQQAATIADPWLYKFGPIGMKAIYPDISIDEDTPLHPSYYETKVVQERRRKGPKIWIQTPNTGHDWRFTGYPIPAKAHAHKSPSFPGKSGPRLIPQDLRSKIRGDHETKPLPDFSILGSTLVVSTKAAEILKAHNIGQTELVPISISAHDHSRIGDGWFAIETREAVSSVIKQQCDKNLLSSLSHRPVLPYEITILGQAHGDLDMWYDPAFTRPVLFFTDRLVKALAKAGCRPRLALKPCEVV